MSFYWRNDTPTFVTWRSSSPNQFVPEIGSPLLCSSYITAYLSFQSTHWLPWQMPHLRFQRFDSLMIWFYLFIYLFFFGGEGMGQKLFFKVTILAISKQNAY